MDVELLPGKYVVAVSGGVDSMALLHILANTPGMTLTVAHFDHGIREDSGQDRLLVQKTAKLYGLPFVFDAVKLGPGASEAAARTARYDFLRKVQKAADADAIVTAHHKDDLLETAVINLIRGTGRKGLTSLKSTDGIRRPLLHVTKAELRDYADKYELQWREDSTNTDPSYLRNHVRTAIIKKLTAEQYQRLHTILADSRETNRQIDSIVDELLAIHGGTRLDRKWFISLPHAVSLEIMAAWLRGHGVRGFDKNMLERLTHAAKIYGVGRSVSVTKNLNLRIGKEYLALVATER